jgi:hypothetical protein
MAMISSLARSMVSVGAVWVRDAWEVRAYGMLGSKSDRVRLGCGMLEELRAWQGTGVLGLESCRVVAE